MSAKPITAPAPSVTIVRMAPGDQRLTCEFSAEGFTADAALFADVRLLPSGDRNRYPCRGGSVTISPLLNGADYEIRITAEAPDGTALCHSADRLFRCGFVPGTVVAYLHPEDRTFISSGNSTCSPSICAAPDGSLLVSHDIFRGRGGQNLTHVYRSEDNGRTWHFASAVTPCFWGSLFVHCGKVYLLATSTEYGALLLYESSDCGFHWSDPLEILPAGSSEAGGPHKAPMPVIEHAGRLWSGIEFGSHKLKMHCPGVVSADMNDDLMRPGAWVCSGFVPYDPALVRDVQGIPAGGTIEGNVVAAPDGRLYDLLRYQTGTCVPQYGKAYMVAIDAEHPDRLPAFARTVDFPGNLTKFFVLRSPADGRYYALSNRVTLGRLNQRNILTLSVSDDLIHWEVRRDILNYADNCFPEDEDKVAFQYPSFLFDGDDILAVSRTAINGAENFHNANFITFHRIRSYMR